VGPDELSRYCRDVEDHLTRVNGGHLVRIVGAGFELVRGWADAGIPLSVVFRGIERKAERHQLGASRRPLRIEFCEVDVRALYDDWRRAVGVPRGPIEGDAAESEPKARRPPSLGRHVERVIDRLGQVAGRTDLPEPFQRALTAALDEAAAIKDDTKGARGAARDVAETRLRELDERLIRAARDTSPRDVLAELGAEAERDLAPFRDRLTGAAWTQAMDATVDRLLRDRLGLPTIGV
jgi:hypothetical protein